MAKKADCGTAVTHQPWIHFGRVCFYDSAQNPSLGLLKLSASFLEYINSGFAIGL
jgi:hypothetical protein